MKCNRLGDINFDTDLGGSHHQTLVVDLVGLNEVVMLYADYQLRRAVIGCEDC